MDWKTLIDCYAQLVKTAGEISTFNFIQLAEEIAKIEGTKPEWIVNLQALIVVMEPVQTAYKKP